MSIASLARPEILSLKPYIAGQQVPGTLRLNANEAPLAAWDDDAPDSLNRYPLARPDAIQARLSELLEVPAGRLLVTRGSSEAIDTLIRAFCRPFVDSILVTPPTFEMYRLYADIQGAALVHAPLDAGNGFRLDPGRVISACTPDTKLVFLCTPNNPTGRLVPEGEVRSIAEARRGRSVIVVDEAYIEFSGTASMSRLVGEFENLVVLRTLSKAHGLAGARCGAAIGSEELIGVMARVLPPYTFPTPVVNAVLNALADHHRERSAALIRNIVAERERLQIALGAAPGVTHLWPSAANFILVRFRDLAGVQSYLRGRKILIRDFSNQNALENCARITIGTRAQNDVLLQALEEYGELAQ